VLDLSLEQSARPIWDPGNHTANSSDWLPLFRARDAFLFQAAEPPRLIRPMPHRVRLAGSGVGRHPTTPDSHKRYGNSARRTVCRNTGEFPVACHGATYRWFFACPRKGLSS
jgi:hypothetical protein